MAIQIDLTGKVALISGASSGIGYATARLFLQAGATVSIASRTPEKLEKASKQLESETKKTVHFHILDTRDENAVKEWADEVLKRFHRIDIVVANTGGPPSGTFSSLSPEQWDSAYTLTFRSIYNMAHVFLPLMKEGRGGRFIAIESFSVRQPLLTLILSNTFRLAVVGMMKTLSSEFGPYGITVNTVAPGYTRTERLLSLAQTLARQQKKSMEDVLNRWAESTPLQRLAKPEEIASACLFLASDLASYITGQVLVVDGGLSRTY